MKNENIGTTLKKYRKLNRLAVRDVVLQLNERYGVNVAEKTVYGWESNQSHPSSDVLVALCDIYRISNVDVFQSSEFKGFAISPEERKIITHYRENPEMHGAIRKILNIKE